MINEKKRRDMERITAPIKITVKRPYMRTVPCHIICRGDGHMVAAALNTDPLTISPENDMPVGYGMNLAEALRELATALEAEVGYSVEIGY